MQLGRSIRLCRTQRNLSQGALADAAGISKSYLCLLERDRRDPPISTLDKIAKALNIPLNIMLFLGAEEEELRGLPVEVRDRLAGVALGLIRAGNAA